MSTITIDGIEADRSAWLEARRGSIGASESPVVLGLAPSRLRLWLAKTTDAIADEPTPEMRRGLLLEPYIAAAWGEETSDPIVETQRFVRHPHMPWLTATLDGLSESGRLVEFKRVGPHGLVRHIEGPDDIGCIPDSWLTQAQHQMLVTGHGEMWFAIKMPDDAVHCVGPVRRSEPLIAIISRECRAFWHDHILPGIPPDEIDPGDAEALARAFRGDTGEFLELGEVELAAAEAYRSLGAGIRELEREREAARARLLLALGDAAGATLPGGWSLSRKVITVNHKPREASVSTQVRLTIREPKP